MNDIIKIHNIVDECEVSYPYKSLIFPGGEPHVQVDPQYIEGKNIWVDARICSADGFMTLLCLLDAISECGPERLGLFLPYFPGARQDRYENGSAFSLQIYGRALRRYSLHSILVLDPHSEMLKAIVDVDALESHTVALPLDSKYRGIIAPDNGALSRCAKFATAAKIDLIFTARKVRNPETGKLSNFYINMENRNGRYLIVDDICDGGGTFIGLADEIKRQSPNCILDLWVSHGIFSKGFYELDKRFGKIITTDSFPREQQPGEWVYHSYTDRKYSGYGPIQDILIEYRTLWYHAAHFMKERLSYAQI